MPQDPYATVIADLYRVIQMHHEELRKLYTDLQETKRAQRLARRRNAA